MAYSVRKSPHAENQCSRLGVSNEVVVWIALYGWAVEQRAKKYSRRALSIQMGRRFYSGGILRQLAKIVGDENTLREAGSLEDYKRDMADYEGTPMAVVRAS